MFMADTDSSWPPRLPLVRSLTQPVAPKPKTDDVYGKCPIGPAARQHIERLKQ